MELESENLQKISHSIWKNFKPSKIFQKTFSNSTTLLSRLLIASFNYPQKE